MGLIYEIPFSSMSGKEYRVDIFREGYTGESKVIDAGESPFVTNLDDDDFLYKPIRTNSATLNVVGGDELLDLYADSPQQNRVLLHETPSERVLWSGFIKPEMYTQEYSGEITGMEIECASALSTLEYVKYERQKSENEDRNNIGFITFQDIIRLSIEKSGGVYNKVYIPHVYGSSKDAYIAAYNILQELSVSEQNFFDEDDEPSNMLEVLEQVCTFLGWTLYEKDGNLYFVDIDNSSGEYYVFDMDLSDYGMINTSQESIQGIGYGGDSHSIDIIPGYNKVKVKCNKYQASTQLEESYEDMETLLADDVYDAEKGNNVSHRVFMRPQKNEYYVYHADSDNSSLTPISFDDVKSVGVNSVIGAIPLRYCNYTMDGSTPSIKKYDYTDVIQARKSVKSGTKGFGCALFKIKIPSMIYDSAIAIAISGSVRVSPWESMAPFGKTSLDTYYSVIPVILRVGDKYYSVETGNWEYDNPDFSEFYKSFPLYYEYDKGTDLSDFVPFKNLKTLNMPFNDLEGFIVRMVGSETLRGELSLTVYAPGHTFPVETDWCGLFIKDFKITFGVMDGFNTGESGMDTVYENEIEGGFVNALDDVELKLTSGEDASPSYSTVAMNGNILSNKLYRGGIGLIRMEEFIVRRLVNQYSAHKIKLTQELEYSEIIPIDMIIDESQPGKVFRMTGCDVDYYTETQTLAMVESVV